MAFLAAVLPSSRPLLGHLVAGFVLLVIGLALLSTRRGPGIPLASAAGTRRALGWAAVYGLCTFSFSRILAAALLGREESPWLLALGDVIFVTLALFVWVLWLVEGRPWAAYGFHGAPRARFALTLVLGLGAAAVVSMRPLGSLVAGHVHVTPDSLVFATLFAVAGAALPGELLFRGYLQGSLEGRHGRWTALALPAVAFTAVRAVRFLPGSDLTLQEWLFQLLGVAFPLGLWWGLMRDLAGGSLWPSLTSHAVVEFVSALANTSPAAAIES